jgi:hypothetical protein
MAKQRFPLPVRNVHTNEMPEDIHSDDRVAYQNGLHEQALEVGTKLTDEKTKAGKAFMDRLRRLPFKDRDAYFAREIRRVLSVVETKGTKKLRSTKELDRVANVFHASYADDKKIPPQEIKNMIGGTGVFSLSTGSGYRKTLQAGLTGKRIPRNGDLVALTRTGGQRIGLGAPGDRVRSDPGPVLGGPNDYSQLQIEMAAVTAALKDGVYHPGDPVTDPRMAKKVVGALALFKTNREAEPSNFFLVREGTRTPVFLFDPRTGEKRWLHGDFGPVGPPGVAGGVPTMSGASGASVLARVVSSKLSRDPEVLKASARNIIQMRGLHISEIKSGKTREGLSLSVIYGKDWRTDIIMQLVPMVPPGATIEELNAVSEILNLSPSQRSLLEHSQKKIHLTRFATYKRFKHDDEKNDEDVLKNMKARRNDLRTLTIETK